MNNVFLYAAKDSKSYRQVEEYLANLSFDETIIVLPPGSQFSSPLCLHLRSNDVIVLYIEDGEAIDELLSIHREYESFRIIIITKSEDMIENDKLMALSPRFISYIDSNFEEFSFCIFNLLKK